MDARAVGYGYVVPMPDFHNSRLGDVVHIDARGFVRWMGRIMEDNYFKELLASQGATEPVVSIEHYPESIVALTTGCWEVKALSKDEVNR
jgi:hypothetical protein